MKYFCSFVGVKLFQFCWKCLVARKNGQKITKSQRLNSLPKFFNLTNKTVDTNKIQGVKSLAFFSLQQHIVKHVMVRD